jgi:tetratricopeptide (TPR) repeat protein
MPITSKSPEAVEHFKKGRALFENVRSAEAVDEFNQALALDPGFATARAYLGLSTPSAAGLKEIEQANSEAAALPETERLFIEAALAGRRDDITKSNALYKQLTDKLPNDWRAHATYGQQLANEQKHAEAIEALRKATALNAKAGTVYNTLGYEYLRQGDVNGAIDAFKQYAALEPNEPNPQDSYGEALLAAGRFDEAAAQFERAATLSPKFWNGWEGVAYVKFYGGDWAGGNQALDKARANAPRPSDRQSIDELAAFAALAKGSAADALKQLDAAASASDATPSQAAQLNVDRAFVYSETGRNKEALAHIASAIDAANGGTLPPFAGNNIRRFALAARATIEARQGQADAAKKTAEELQKEASTRPDDSSLQSTMHYALGMASLAAKDFANTASHLSQCVATDYFCRWQHISAAEKAGDKAAAQAAREGLLSLYQRDPIYLYVRTKLAPPSAAARKTN